MAAASVVNLDERVGDGLESVSHPQLARLQIILSELQMVKEQEGDSEENHMKYLKPLIKYMTDRLEHQEHRTLVREMTCVVPDVAGLSHFLHMFISPDVALVRDVPVWDSGYFPVGSWCHSGECSVCLEQVTCTLRSCCNAVICDVCIKSYVSTQLNEGQLRMACPASACDQYLHHREVEFHLSEVERERFKRHLDSAANSTSTRKSCPNCYTFKEVSEKDLRNASKKHGLQVECSGCLLLWCFTCHAPQHDGLSCKQYRTGDLLLRQWAHHHKLDNNSRNAQKCPRCKFYIERSSGCDHMTCSKCGTQFCYLCGRTRRSIKFLGDHDSCISILGCPNNLLRDQPHLRRLVRGTVFSSAAVCVVTAGAAVVPISLVALPALGIYKLTKKLKRHLEERREQQMMQPIYERHEAQRRQIAYLMKMYEHQKDAHDETEDVTEGKELDDEDFFASYRDLLEGTELDPDNEMWSFQKNLLRYIIEELVTEED